MLPHISRIAKTNHQQTTPKQPRTDGPNNQNRTRHSSPSLDGHHQRKHSTTTRKTLTCKTTGAYSVSGVENTGNTSTPPQLQQPSTPTTTTAKDQNDRTTQKRPTNNRVGKTRTSRNRPNNPQSY